MILPAAVVAAVLFVAMAGFQASLAAGAPLGAHVLGGSHAGRLPARLRIASGIAAILLLVCALVVLARAGAIPHASSLDGVVAAGCWVVAGFLVLNTLANLASRSKLERTLFAAMTAVLAILAVFVALPA
jgi:hypothetical protein